jgi:hypothetical protein
MCDHRVTDRRSWVICVQSIKIDVRLFVAGFRSSQAPAAGYWTWRRSDSTVA